MNNFPPQPRYPRAIDSDYTLFKVYNTTETVLTSSNAAWSEEISIKPQAVDKPEIWPDNGFATIEGELLYYDSVEKDVNDRVNKLKRCLRNIGGKQTQYNAAGTWIRGFVVAEHHNQIVDAILKIEDFIGENFSEDEETLDWRIRNLQAEPLVFDDFSCPDVEFNFNIIENDPNTGTLASYVVNISGVAGSIEVQFGDGTSTSQTFGTHRYAPNADIDPVVIVSNGQCQIVQTPISRDSIQQPEVQEQVPPFTVPIPLNPQLPVFNFPSQAFPSVDIVIPPIVFPCLDLNPILASLPSFTIPDINLDIPSFITFIPELNIPSIITLMPSIDIPSFITFLNVPSFDPIQIIIPSFNSTVTFENFPSFTSTITFVNTPSFGSTITFVNTPSFTSTITFTNVPSFTSAISIDINTTNLQVLLQTMSLQVDVTSLDYTLNNTFISVDVSSLETIIQSISVDVSQLQYLLETQYISIDVTSLQNQYISIDVTALDLLLQNRYLSIDTSSLEFLLDNRRIQFDYPPSFDCISFCVPSFENISFDLNVNLSLEVPNVSFVNAPSFSEFIYFVNSPSFPEVVYFANTPSFDCISICVPSIDPIQVMFPSIANIQVLFSDTPSFDCIPFCDPPSFQPIGFDAIPSFPKVLFDVSNLWPIVSFDIPTFPAISLNLGSAYVSVDWGTPPTLSVNVACTGTSSMAMASMRSAPVFGAGRMPFANKDQSFNEPEMMEVQYEMVGFPSEIKVAPPNIPPISVIHNIPSFLEVRVPEFKDIRIVSDFLMPSEIRMVPPEKMFISVMEFNIPTLIGFDVSDLPSFFSVRFPEEIPVLKIDASSIPESIKVVGFPETIRIEHNIPSKIEFEMPEGLKVPLVFEGPAISAQLNVNWGFEKIFDGEDQPQCFAIVPCPKR
jgi:hypothetical protein